MNKLIYLLPVLFWMLIGSCKKSTVVVVDLGYDYFPVETGKYIIYTVDSIFVDEPVNVTDTFHYQIKEVITGEYIDNEGNVAQRIERFYRSNDTLPWTIKDVWASNRLSQSGQRVEENVRLIKMTFPVKADQLWDGNALNIKQERPFTYQEFNVPKTVNGMMFDSTATIITTLEPNLVDTIIDTEIRAKDIGVVFKHLVETNTQVDATTGFKLTMSVIAHGIE